MMVISHHQTKRLKNKYRDTYCRYKRVEFRDSQIMAEYKLVHYTLSCEAKCQQ